MKTNYKIKNLVEIFYIYWRKGYVPFLHKLIFFNFFLKLMSEKTKGKIIFKGNFWEYFAINIALAVLTFITFGIALPYVVYWNVKYFVANLEIEMY